MSFVRRLVVFPPDCAFFSTATRTKRRIYFVTTRRTQNSVPYDCIVLVFFFQLVSRVDRPIAYLGIFILSRENTLNLELGCRFVKINNGSDWARLRFSYVFYSSYDVVQLSFFHACTAVRLCITHRCIFKRHFIHSVLFYNNVCVWRIFFRFGW